MDMLKCENKSAGVTRLTPYEFVALYIAQVEVSCCIIYHLHFGLRCILETNWFYTNEDIYQHSTMLTFYKLRSTTSIRHCMTDVAAA